MKHLRDFKENIHKCSKCGLCQGECPLYKSTGNDCTVSRGMFVMLRGYLKGELKLSRTIKKYLDLCLKCGKCSQFCPSGIDVVDIIAAAKSEYYNRSIYEKLVSFLQKNIIFGLIPNFFSLFHKPYTSKRFDKKVLYYGGCGSKFKGDKSIVKIMNALNIEVVNPKFDCCGVSLFVRGDFRGFSGSIKKYIRTLKKYNITEVVTTCASCEKSLKEYYKWADDYDKEFLQTISVRNIYEYVREKELKLTLVAPQKITFHKPCHLHNFEDVEWVLNNTENLKYIRMEGFDECCGLNGLTNIKEYKTLSKIFNKKRENILKTETETVLTSCLGCETALKVYSKNEYEVCDLIDFIAKNL